MRRAFATLWSHQVADPENLRQLTRHKQSITYWGYVRRTHADEVKDATSQLSVVKLAKAFAAQLLNDTEPDSDSSID